MKSVFDEKKEKISMTTIRERSISIHENSQPIRESKSSRKIVKQLIRENKSSRNAKYSSSRKLVLAEINPIKVLDDKTSLLQVPVRFCK